MTEAVLPGDLSAGDVIALPDEDDDLVVRVIQLGRGGFLLTVSDLNAPSPSSQRIITLTAGTHVLRHGKAAGF
jgi:hypothetical protein